MKSRLLTEDKSKVLSTGVVRLDKIISNDGRVDLTFWYEPFENRAAFMAAIQELGIFTIEAGTDLYKVSGFGGDAMSSKPFKFKPAPVG
jgi:hypothetical protein